MSDEFFQAFRGSFTSTLRWHQLDALWGVLRETEDDGWYVYAVGDTPPGSPRSHRELLRFIGEVDQLLRTEHQEDFCGIVYADDLQKPTLIKIYDPNNLGVVCGYSDNPPLPGWVLSKIKPCDLPAAQALVGGRRHWWQRLFSE